MTLVSLLTKTNEKGRKDLPRGQRLLSLSHSTVPIVFLDVFRSPHPCRRTPARRGGEGPGRGGKRARCRNRYRHPCSLMTTPGLSPPPSLPTPPRSCRSGQRRMRRQGSSLAGCHSCPSCREVGSAREGTVAARGWAYVLGGWGLH